MDTAQWPQEIVVKPMEEIVVPKGTTSTTTTTICSNNSSKPTSSSTSSLERRTRPHQKEQIVNCPRCNSTNTKFCYYNNYSLSQPRYFCKTCRRYWTEGGSLRNIPVGGGSRKNKRPSSSSSTSSSSISNPSSTPSKNLITLPDLVQAPSSSSHHQNPNNKIFDHHGQDLNLGFPSTHDFKTISELIQVPSFDGNSTKSNLQTTNSTTSGNNTSHLSALELLTGMTTRGLNSFMPMPIPIPDPNAVYSSGFSFPEFKVPSLGFSLDGIGSNNGYGSLQENGNGGRHVFPFEDLKQVSSTTAASQHDDHHLDQSRDHQNGDSNGYWNGMLGGGSW